MWSHDQGKGYGVFSHSSTNGSGQTCCHVCYGDRGIGAQNSEVRAQWDLLLGRPRAISWEEGE